MEELQAVIAVVYEQNSAPVTTGIRAEVARSFIGESTRSSAGRGGTVPIPEPTGKGYLGVTLSEDGGAPRRERCGAGWGFRASRWWAEGWAPGRSTSRKRR